MADHKIDGNDGAGNVQAPERIWASNRTNGNCVVSFTSRSEEYSIEYIRADVAADQLAAMTDARDELASAIDDIETSHGLTDNGNLWRFWAKTAREIAAKNTNLSAQLAAANARCEMLADSVGKARDDALVEAADKLKSVYRVSITRVGGVDVYGSDAGSPASCYHTILALRDKPAPAVTVPITTVQEAARVLLGVFEDPDANAPHGFDWQSMYDEMTADHKESLDICGTHDWPSTLIVALRAIAPPEA